MVKHNWKETGLRGFSHSKKLNARETQFVEMWGERNSIITFVLKKGVGGKFTSRIRNKTIKQSPNTYVEAKKIILEYIKNN